jgi:hypothetical protein
MPGTTYTYASYYHPSQHVHSQFSSLPYPDAVPLSPLTPVSPVDYSDYPVSPQDHIGHHMQPPPSPGIPIDPALALYPPYNYQYGQQHHMPHPLSLPQNYSSPSSNGSDTIGTPPADQMYGSSSSNMNGKRPASVMSTMSTDSRKKARKDDESNPASPAADKEEKAKPTRGSRSVSSSYLNFGLG